MADLASWLETHKETLVVQSVQRLTEREVLRRHVEGPVRWFFDSLIEALVQGHQKRLESLLRNWVRLCSVPINGESVGVLPVLGVFKRILWQAFEADPPPSNPLAMAIELDGIIVQATEYLAKVEAAALMDEFNHQLAAQNQVDSDEDSKANFIAVAGHELKTPLTVIEGYSNMLKLEISEASAPRAALMVQGIESGVVRLRALIEDLIDVSLLESSLFQLEYQPVWLRRVLEIAHADVKDVLRQRSITFTMDLEAVPSKPIVADPTSMLKAFRKVLENAIKYTPDGGTITLRASRRNNFIDMVVRDSGIGIDPQHIERIFEKFSPLGNIAHHSSSKFKFKGGGAGLGLVIAKGILEAHGGTVWAESDGYDEHNFPGSAFHIILPLRDVMSGEGMSPLIAQAMEPLMDRLSRDTQTAIKVSAATQPGEKTKSTAVAQVQDVSSSDTPVRPSPSNGHRIHASDTHTGDAEQPSVPSNEGTAPNLHTR